jgi:ATP-dependent RNA helicase RhlE
MTSFENLKLNKQLLNAVADIGFSTPTEIQTLAIPQILAGQHIIGIAQTGTGKTAAYVLPLLRILNYEQGTEPRALIVAPTRELVLQITQVFNALGKYTGIRVLSVFGGKGFSDQKKKLSEGCDIVVGTPAQILELYLTNFLILKKIKHFVLDEAERLMDFGFTPQLHKLLEVLPRKRQNILFSATFSERVKRTADDFMEFPVVINIVPEIKTVATVEQVLYKIPNFGTKSNFLQYLLSKQDVFKKTIVFCKSKKTANAVFENLKFLFEESGINILHGDKAQQTRTNTLNAFREGRINILITTDVTARGIDVSEVTHVINFDVPFVYEDYVHRTGRTGRAFNTGTCITFCTPAEEWHIKKIQKLIGFKIPVQKLPEEIAVAKISFNEHQEQAMEIDRQKRKDNPDFKGAFHEKKFNKDKDGHRKK